MKLTKTMRTEVLTKVLKEVFEPKFNDLQKRLVEYGRLWVQEHHSIFVELLAQWVKYTGSDEQIAEMRNAEHGFMAKNITSISSVMSIKFNQLFIQGQKGPYLPELFCNKLENFLTHNNTIEYLICEPHPLADMICQQARTGQPVWWRNKNSGGTGLCHEYFPPFMHPVEFEYSFMQFEEEV